MPYIANTDRDRAAMLRAIGIENMEDLWRRAGVTEPTPSFDSLPPGRSEMEVTRLFSDLAAANRTDLISFAGGGYYEHFIPAAVSQIVERGEFLTSYTPYQAEASQGTLQAIYEYQSMICRLTAMEVANASLYDGGTALFEAILMALRRGKRRKVLLAGSLSPIYRKMIESAGNHLDADFFFTSATEGSAVKEELRATLDGKTAAVVIPYPDFSGGLYDWTEVIEAAHRQGALALCSCYPMVLSQTKSPGEMGFDIVTGEGQSLGNPLSFGGPCLGFMATTKALFRKMPGRICGRGGDREGRKGFVLTLQAREQHIRRAEATSNVCTNQSLLALRAVVYLTLLGKRGFQQVGKLCAAKAAYARGKLLTLPGITSVSDAPFFNEFTVKLPRQAGTIAGALIPKGFVAGIPLGLFYPERAKELLIAVTELRTKEEIDAFVQAVREVL